MAKMKPRILAVDDEVDMLETYKTLLSKNYDVVTAACGEDAINAIKSENISLVLLDIRMPGTDGIEVLRTIKAVEPDLDVIMVTASKEIRSAVECIKLGAYDYVTKPFEADELKSLISRALKKRELVIENTCLRAIIKETDSYCELIGGSAPMKKVFNLIDDVSRTDSTVLINGESGTGKELVAKAIHNKSERADKPFVTVNCAAIPDSLLESELFGFEAGTFTGAYERKIGKFELANGGSVFLDEIGCMSPGMQAKLLRVLEGKLIDRIGGKHPVAVDVRIISATNLDFKSAVRDGKFRDDLYYRLNVIPVFLPPLRERPEDIPLLTAYFISKFNMEMNKKVKGFSEEAMGILRSYSWPGNVRELQNLIERVVALSKNGTIRSGELPIEGAGRLAATRSKVRLLGEAASSFEKEHIRDILDEASWNQSKAARLLGIHRTTLISKMKFFDLRK